MNVMRFIYSFGKLSLTVIFCFGMGIHLIRNATSDEAESAGILAIVAGTLLSVFLAASAFRKR